MAETIREAWACPVEEEKPVAPPLVKREGRMDVIAARWGQKLLIDVVVGMTATDTTEELARRVHQPGRSL